MNLQDLTASRENSIKSASTALAVKACVLGGHSHTKCSITFVSIAVAISALAGGKGRGAKNCFASPEAGGVFDFFRGFWVSELKRVCEWNFG